MKRSSMNSCLREPTSIAREPCWAVPHKPGRAAVATASQTKENGHVRFLPHRILHSPQSINPLLKWLIRCAPRMPPRYDTSIPIRFRHGVQPSTGCAQQPCRSEFVQVPRAPGSFPTAHPHAGSKRETSALRNPTRTVRRRQTISALILAVNKQTCSVIPSRSRLKWLCVKELRHAAIVVPPSSLASVDDHATRGVPARELC